MNPSMADLLVAIALLGFVIWVSLTIISFCCPDLYGWPSDITLAEVIKKQLCWLLALSRRIW